MVKCIFTSGDECCKCIICNHKEQSYKCVNCGYTGLTSDLSPVYAQRCEACNGFIGIKECKEVEV